MVWEELQNLQVTLSGCLNYREPESGFQSLDDLSVRSFWYNLLSRNLLDQESW